METTSRWARLKRREALLMAIGVSLASVIILVALYTMRVSAVLALGVVSLGFMAAAYIASRRAKAAAEDGGTKTDTPPPTA